MDVEKVNLLKDKGNKAYVDGNYDEALDFYKEALESAGSGDTNIAAIVHSNISQTYLKKKDYLLAAESATESLKLDSSFKKSNLRRATANIELDNFVDAMNDLRLIFLLEPKNKTAKDLMRRCSDKPKMKRELHMVYAKHCLRQILKKLDAQTMCRQDRVCPIWSRNALLRQSLLSMRGLGVANNFFCGTFVGFHPSHYVFVNFSGWKLHQFMWFGYSFSPISIEISGNLFNLLYQLFRSGTFLLTIISQYFLIDETLLLNKYLDVYLLKEPLLFEMPVDMNDLKTMDHYSNGMTRLVYHPGLADLKNTLFPKAKTLAFCADDQITSNFLKSWKESEWPIESLFFVHGVPELQVINQFNEIVSNDVKNVFIRLGERDQKFNNVAYDKLCCNLATLKSVFPNFDDVTITHRFVVSIQDFPQFAQGLSLIHEAYNTISTKPKWCPKLKVAIFVEFMAELRAGSKMFNVELLEQSVESLRQKHPKMQARLFGPKSYAGFWALTPCVHAVIEFENEVAQFELAMSYRYPFD